MASNKKKAINYESTKFKYYRLLTSNPDKYKLTMNRDQYNQVVNNLLKCEQQHLQGKDCSDLTNHTCYQEYALYRENGVPYLIRPRTDLEEPIIKYLTSEEIFDVLYAIHTRNRHCKQIRLQSIVEKTYVISRRYIDLLINCCNICVNKNERMGRLLFRYRPVYVDVIGLTSIEAIDDSFTYILYVENIPDSFVFLRPLIRECQREVAYELLKNFLTFGPPDTLIVGNPRKKQFFRNALTHLEELGLSISIPVAMQVSQVTRLETTKQSLEDWRIETNSTNWGMGCHIVQWRLNNQTVTYSKNEMKLCLETPYNLVFGYGHNNESEETGSELIDNDFVYVESDYEPTPTASNSGTSTFNILMCDPSAGYENNMKSTLALLQNYNDSSDEDER